MYLVDLRNEMLSALREHPTVYLYELRTGKFTPDRQPLVYPNSVNMTYGKVAKALQGEGLVKLCFDAKTGFNYVIKMPDDCAGCKTLGRCTVTPSTCKPWYRQKG